MMIKKLLKQASMLVLILCCSTPLFSETEAIRIENGDRIAFLGDSITAAGWGNDGGYVKLVIDGLAKVGVATTPIPAGVSGHKSNDMLARLERDVLSKDVDWMTLSCGVNDVWHGDRGVNLEDYQKNITAIVDQATAKGIHVVIMTSTPIGEGSNPNNDKLVAYNDFLRAFAKKRGITLVDLSAIFYEILTPLNPTGSSRILTVDGVHMNPNGNVLMAQSILKAFGLKPAQIQSIEQEWLNQAGTAVMSSHKFDPRARLTMTLGQYRTLCAAAEQSNSSVFDMFQSIWYRSVAEVVESHSSDLVLAPELIKSETNQLFAQKIEELESVK
ncbi:SGNH/GDSL hydrolase family protein [Coraliomargarita sp. W4R72]